MNVKEKLAVQIIEQFLQNSPAYIDMGGLKPLLDLFDCMIMKDVNANLDDLFGEADTAFEQVVSFYVDGLLDHPDIQASILRPSDSDAVDVKGIQHDMFPEATAITG